jgi:hypothetical protein
MSKMNAHTKAGKGKRVRQSVDEMPQASSPQPVDGITEATLFEAIRAEVARVRTVLKADAEKAETSLETIEGMLDTIETKLEDIVGLVKEAEEHLGPAALAFASVDAIAPGDGDEDRGTFSVSLGMVVACLRCVPVEIGNITKLEAAEE